MRMSLKIAALSPTQFIRPDATKLDSLKDL